MIDEFKRFEFFVGMDEKVLADLAGFCVRRTYEAQQVIYERDDEATNSYVVIAGRVRQGFEVMPGSMAWFQTSEPGDLVGFDALIGPRVHNMRAVASEKSELAVFDSAALLDYLESNPAFGFVFMEHLAAMLLQRLNNARLQVIHLMPPKEQEGPTL